MKNQQFFLKTVLVTIIGFITLLINSTSLAQEIELIPRPANFFSDQIQLFTEAEATSLTKKLSSLNTDLGIEVYFVSITAYPENLTEYAQKILKNWTQKPLSVLIMTDKEKRFAVVHTDVHDDHIGGLNLDHLVKSSTINSRKFILQKDRAEFLINQFYKDIKFIAHRAVKVQEGRYAQVIENQESSKKDQRNKILKIATASTLGILSIITLLLFYIRMKFKNKILHFPKVDPSHRLGGTRAGGTVFSYTPLQ